MPLSAGTRLGHYDVTALFGEGGMGQVWQATDTQLGREVALKILPDAFAADPERLARFKREAQILASLNHPNIAAIYGIEEAEGTRALVLELVEGPTLADRIKQGPIPLDEALPIAKQIAEALEAAHEQGVIHRDLKPANVKVKADGTVKVLDFGLAKAFQPDASDPNMSMSPTISLTAAATQMGMVIGTAAYMAPEQARGQPVDKRADVWAFGAVLFEMLSGRRVFEGRDVSETLAGVIKSEAPWEALPSDTPAKLDKVLRRCLEKEPKHRIRDIGDVQLAMEGAFETTVSTSSEPTVALKLQVWQRPVAVLGALVIAVLVTGLGVWAMMRPEPEGLVRFTIVPPDTAQVDFSGPFHDLAISPDGTQIVYQAQDGSGSTGLNLRPIDQFDGAPLRGAERDRAPFFSPDGEWVGFSSGPTTISKVSILGGAPLTVTTWTDTILGASWGTDDRIIFGTRVSGLFSVSGDGGEPEILTTLDAELGESGHFWPSIISSENAVLFVTATGAALSTGRLAVLDLDTDEVTRLGLAGSSPHYVSTGHLVYVGEDGSIRAVPFDPARLEVTGSPVPLVEDVAVKYTGAADFSISDNGRLVFVLGGGVFPKRSLVWVDRDGREEAISAPPRSYEQVDVSPDGTGVALDIRDQENDIWVWTVPDGPLTRLTLDADQDTYGHWTADGERVVFSSRRDGSPNVYWKAADGTGTVDRLTEGRTNMRVNAVTPDGTRVITRESIPNRGYDLMVVTLDGDPATETLLSTEFNETNAAISPDGTSVAYESDASGQPEVYVRPFPDLEAGLRQVSTAGGRFPVWAPDGDELFFLQGNRLMAAPVESGGSLPPGSPDVLFEANYYFGFGSLGVGGVGGGGGLHHDVAPDGRFLMIKAGSQTDENAPPPQINVVLNWTEELKERVPLP